MPETSPGSLFVVLSVVLLVVVSVVVFGDAVTVGVPVLPDPVMVTCFRVDTSILESSCRLLYQVTLKSPGPEQFIASDRRCMPPVVLKFTNTVPDGHGASCAPAMNAAVDPANIIALALKNIMLVNRRTQKACWVRCVPKLAVYYSIHNKGCLRGTIMHTVLKHKKSQHFMKGTPDNILRSGVNATLACVVGGHTFSSKTYHVCMCFQSLSNGFTETIHCNAAGRAGRR